MNQIFKEKQVYSNRNFFQSDSHPSMENSQCKTRKKVFFIYLNGMVGCGTSNRTGILRKARRCLYFSQIKFSVWTFFQLLRHDIDWSERVNIFPIKLILFTLSDQSISCHNHVILIFMSRLKLLKYHVSFRQPLYLFQKVKKYFFL